jgi:hypothetical protein
MLARLIFLSLPFHDFSAFVGLLNFPKLLTALSLLYLKSDGALAGLPVLPRRLLLPVRYL